MSKMSVFVEQKKLKSILKNLIIEVRRESLVKESGLYGNEGDGNFKRRA